MKYNKVDYSSYYLKNIKSFGKFDNVKDSGESYEDLKEKDEKYPQDDSGEYSPEYIGRDKKKYRMKDNGKKVKKKSSSRKTLIVIVTILLCFAVTILVADSLTGGYVLEEIQTILAGKSSIIKTYYGVECGTFNDLESARLYANGLRAKGGAGYVMKDEFYRVFVEIYSSEEEAEQIAKSLKLSGEDAKVYKFNIKEFDYGKFPDSTRNVVKNVLKYNDRIYLELYTIGVELDKGNIDTNTAISRIRGLKEEMHNVVVEFEADVDNKVGDINVIKVTVQLKAIEGALLNLSEDTVKRQNLLADIRYSSCLIVNSYRQLSEEMAYKQ